MLWHPDAVSHHHDVRDFSPTITPSGVCQIKASPNLTPKGSVYNCRDRRGLGTNYIQIKIGKVTSVASLIVWPFFSPYSPIFISKGNPYRKFLYPLQLPGGDLEWSLQWLCLPACPVALPSFFHLSQRRTVASASSHPTGGDNKPRPPSLSLFPSVRASSGKSPSFPCKILHFGEHSFSWRWSTIKGLECLNYWLF